MSYVPRALLAGAAFGLALAASTSAQSPPAPSTAPSATTKAAPTTQELLQQARNLPPVSLTITNATADQAFAALNASLNTARKITHSAETRDSYTLHVENKPFWEVFLALDQQHQLLVTHSPSTLNYTDPFRYHAIDGPVLGYVTGVDFGRTLDFQSSDEPRRMLPRFSIDIHLRVDPRVGEWQEMSGGGKVTKAVDDLGHDLTPFFVPPGTPAAPVPGPFDPVPPPRLGKMISLTYETSIAYNPITLAPIAELPADVGQVVPLVIQPAGRFGTTISSNYRVTEFATPPDGNIHFRFEVTSNQMRGGEGGSGMSRPPAYALVDANGIMIWSSLDPKAQRPYPATPNDSPPIIIPAGNSKAPYKFLVESRVGAQRDQIPIRLEFKDFPLRPPPATRPE
jgi:hypothetical protein